MLSIILLTFNSEASVQRTLAAAKQLSTDIYAVDSFSTDSTLEILKDNGVIVIQRGFKNYSDQRNWAIDNLEVKYEWQMHIDADEELEPQLIRELKNIDFSTVNADGFIIGRKIVFMGKILKFGGIAKTWHYRIFRRNFGRCEDRLYDQHFVSAGRVETINGFMLDHQEDSIAEWTRRHNRWSDMEAEEALVGAAEARQQIRPELSGNKIQKARAKKGIYYRAPLFIRPTIYFIYRYFLLMGFRDGTEGLIYNVLQGFWFRFLVDVKIYEMRKRGKN